MADRQIVMKFSSYFMFAISWIGIPVSAGCEHCRLSVDSAVSGVEILDCVAGHD
jgi:hypothetical protein